MAKKKQPIGAKPGLRLVFDSKKHAQQSGKRKVAGGRNDPGAGTLKQMALGQLAEVTAHLQRYPSAPRAVVALVMYEDGTFNGQGFMYGDVRSCDARELLGTLQLLEWDIAAMTKAIVERGRG